MTDEQAALLLLFAESLVNEEELLAIYDYFGSKNPAYPYWRYKHVNIDELTGDECLSEFCIEKEDLPRLLRVLKIPAKVICPNGSTANGMEALCILLRRFAYPCRYSDLIPRFGRSVPELSLIVSEITRHISQNFGHLLISFDQDWLRPVQLHRYAETVFSKCGSLENCWGFIDGTVRPICRSTKNQRVVYNGHKRVHSLKFQAVVAANGMIANLYGPVEGKRHDAAMLRMSGLMDQLELYSVNPAGQILCLYGDAAYPHRPHLQSPYRHNNLTVQEQLFNSSMSEVRVSVEWVFGEIARYFAFLDFKKNLKIGLSPVRTTYQIASLLHNARTCLLEIKPANL